MRKSSLVKRVLGQYEGVVEQEPKDVASGRVPRSAIRKLDHIASAYGVTRGRLVSDLVMAFIEDWDKAQAD